MHNYQPLSSRDVESNSIGLDSQERRLPRLNHFPPNYIIPHNTVFTLTTTEGTFRPQYYLPDELKGFMSFDEFNSFVNQFNNILTATKLGLVPHLLITALFILVAYLFVGKGKGYDLPIFDSVLLGILAAQVFVFVYLFFRQSYGKKHCQEFIMQKNHQLFLNRGCHWEECVFGNQVFLHLIRHPSRQPEIHPVMASFAPAVIIPFEVHGATTKV